MPIPPDIDELMWAIAENDTPDAVYDFEHRFPKYQQELMRRIKTVQALKAQGKTVPSREIPVFQARPVTVDRKPIHWLGYAAVSIAVVSTAVLAATRNQPNLEPIPAPINTKRAVPPTVPELPGSKNTIPMATPPVDIAKNPPAAIKQSSNKYDAIIEVAKLHDAIQLIGQIAHVNITIAPGLENPDVQLNFSQMTAMEMLSALGKDYAFTPIVNGEKEILILPVKDDAEPPIQDNELH